MRGKMEHIIQIYGKVFVSAAAAVLLAALLLGRISDRQGNQGILSMAGAHLSAVLPPSGTPEEFRTVDAENQKKAPEILFQQKDSFYAGKIKILEWIKAVDYQGRELPVRLLKLENPDGDDITGQYHKEDGWLEMTMPGIYTMTVWALDEDNRKTVAAIHLPVNPVRRLS